jgi:hypothetical protein
MVTIEEALDRCLEKMIDGSLTIDDCVAEFPQFADKLKSALRTAKQLKRGQQLRPSRDFKARLRSQIAPRSPRRRFFHLFAALFVLVGVTTLIFVLAGSGLSPARLTFNLALPALPMLFPELLPGYLSSGIVTV